MAEPSFTGKFTLPLKRTYKDETGVRRVFVFAFDTSVSSSADEMAPELHLTAQRWRWFGKPEVIELRVSN